MILHSPCTLTGPFHTLPRCSAYRAQLIHNVLSDPENPKKRKLKKVLALRGFRVEGSRVKGLRFRV